MTDTNSNVTEIRQRQESNGSFTVPRSYSGFDGQYISGAWRPGRNGATAIDTNPYSGETLAEIVLADKSNLDETYRAAAQAQISWAKALPSERAAVMFRAAAIMDSRHEEIVDWLIRESGSTRTKAEFEWNFVRTVTLESGSFPHRVEGKILAIDEAGKESRAYRLPLGVIGIISPWNFPMYLSHRSSAGDTSCTCRSMTPGHHRRSG
jgi:aldehyde dehydrogenase (NAD+)